MKVLKSVSVAAGIFSLIALVASPAQAAVPTETSVAATPVATSQTSTEAGPTSWTQKITSSFKSEFFGPTLNQPSTQRPDALSGKLTSKNLVRTENSLTTGYRITPSVSSGFALQSDFVMANNGSMSLKDPFLFFRDASVLKAGSFNLMLTGRAYLPVSELARTSNTVLGLRFLQDTSYSLAGTRFGFESSSYIHRAFFSNAAVSVKDYKYFLNPRFTYRLLANLEAVVAYKYWASHKSGDSFYKLGTDAAYVSPGMTWGILSNLNLTPYLDFTTAGETGLDKTTLGAVLSWRLI